MTASCSACKQSEHVNKPARHKQLDNKMTNRCRNSQRASLWTSCTRCSMCSTGRTRLKGHVVKKTNDSVHPLFAIKVFLTLERGIHQGRKVFLIQERGINQGRIQHVGLTLRSGFDARSRGVLHTRRRMLSQRTDQITKKKQLKLHHNVFSWVTWCNPGCKNW